MKSNKHIQETLRSASNAPVRLIALFALFVLVSAVNMLVVYRVHSLAGNDVAAVNIAGRNSTLSQRIAFLAKQIVRDNAPYHYELEEAIGIHNAALYALKDGVGVAELEGNPTLPRPSSSVSPLLQDAERIWVPYRDNARVIVRAESDPGTVSDEEVAAALRFIEENAERVLFYDDAVVSAYSAEDAGNQTTFLIVSIVSAVFQVVFTGLTYLLARKVSGTLHADVVKQEKLLQELARNEESMISRDAELKNQQDAMLNVLEDLQDEKKKLTEKEEQLEEAQKIGKFGNFVWDITNDRVIWSDQSFIIHGMEPVEGHVAPHDWYTVAIHPDDRVAAAQSIESATKTVGETGHTYRVEWPDKTIHFVRMVSQLQPVKKGEPKIIKGTFQDITREMEIDKAKTEFVSLASHQLRTPLATVNWYTEMLLSEDAGKIDGEQKEYLEEIYASNKRMVELVNSLLNVSRLELGTFTIEPEPTDIVELMQSVIDEQMPQIRERKHTFTTKLAKDIPIMPLDTKLLRMVFQNLLSNAVKYTPVGGVLSVDVAHDAENVSVRVADNGLGIPASEKERIFSKLFRATNARESDTEGTGLGLYIVKTIVEESGGTIRFESEENKGTTFFVTLPLEGMKKKAGSKRLDAPSKPIRPDSVSKSGETVEKK